MKVFISYRRNDAYWPAQNIRAELSKRIPSENIFIDVDSIPAGIEFRDYIHEKLDQVDVLIAVIGKRWASESNEETGKSRLFEPDDLVRLEIEGALSRSIKVVPVLVDGAQFPDADSMPESMSGLLRRNGEVINNLSFETDCKRLVRKLGISNGLSIEPRTLKTVSAVAGLAIVALTMAFVLNPNSSSNQPVVDRSPADVAKLLVERDIGDLIENADPDELSDTVRRCYELAGHNLDPNLPAGVSGNTITELGKVANEADQTCGEALRADPTDSTLLWMYSRVRASRGERAGQVEFLEVANDLGSVAAGVTLAIRLMEGRGIANDYERAKELLRIGLEKGDPRAIALMSVFPSYGLTVPVDKSAAYELNFDAAKRGLSRSQYNVCVQKVHGIGVEKELQFGAGFCQAAAQSSTDPVAQNYFGWLLETGTGVERDLDSALNYYNLAASGEYRLGDLNRARLSFSNATDISDALDIAEAAVSEYLSSDFDPIADDVFFVYEGNPDEVKMIDAFIVECEALLTVEARPELSSLILQLKLGRQAGRYPTRVLLQPAVGSYAD